MVGISSKFCLAGALLYLRLNVKSKMATVFFVVLCSSSSSSSSSSGSIEVEHEHLHHSSGSIESLQPSPGPRLPQTGRTSLTQATQASRSVHSTIES